MSKQVYKKLEHSPTLNTVIMVEETLQNMENSVMTIPELKRALPKQVNHNTLMLILEYLEKSCKIYVGLKGITWTVNNNPRFQEAIKNGYEM